MSTPKKKTKPSVDDSKRSPNRWKVRPALNVGCKISGKWNQDGPNKGDWYDGVVKSINVTEKTLHVVFNDGDEDNELSWSDVRIL